MSDRWLECSLETDAETAEAIHEALFPIVSGRIALEQTNGAAGVAVARWEDEAPQGPVIVRAWIALDEPDTHERCTQVERALAALRLIRPLPQPSWRETRQSDWTEAWRASFQPLRIGERVLIRPSWSAADATARRSGDIEIVLDPGMAFGTGLHPTTQLCVQAMLDYVQPGDRVLDVGCGSGILSILAAKLGATAVMGVDTDAEAVRVSEENARLNAVGDHVRFAHGSFEQAERRYDLVVANILAPVIARLLADGLAERGCRFIFSGILDAQMAEVQVACDQTNLRVLEMRHSGDWVVLVAQRADQAL